MQRHPGSDLDALCRELFARLDVRIAGIADDDTGRLEAFGRDALEACTGKQCADLRPELRLGRLGLVEAVRLGVLHDLTEGDQRVRRHGGMIGVRTALIRRHDLQPFAQVTGKTGAGRFVDALAGESAEHDQAAARRTAPAFLRGADQDVDAAGLHVDPDGAGGDAIEHEHTADGVHSVGNGADIIVRQDHAGSGFNVRRKDQVGSLGGDRRDNLFDRRRGEGGVGTVFDLAGFEYGVGRRDVAGLEDLRPAEAEPAVADDQAIPAGSELAGNRFHAKRAAARHDNDGGGVVDLAQGRRDVVHDTLELLRHMVHCAVGVDDRVFEQAFGIDVGQQAGHGNLHWVF